MQDKSQGEIPDPKNSSAQRSRCCGLSRVEARGSRLIISLPKFSLRTKQLAFAFLILAVTPISAQQKDSLEGELASRDERP